MVLHQPFACIFGVVLEPGAARTQAKAVAPFVHVPEHAFTAKAGQVICKQDLQVADAVFLVIAAAGVGVQLLSALPVHAHIVAGLVEGGMQWGVRTHQQGAADEPGFGVAEMGAGNGDAVVHPAQFQAVFSDQSGQ